MRVAVVLDGDPPAPDELKLLDACEQVVCADGAAAVLLQAERPPQCIVGDLDSLEPEAYKWADALDIPIERHPSDKDDTDGELAVEKALSFKPRSILFLGAHGGRTAMFLANLKLLRRCHEEGLDAVMIGRGEAVRFVSAGGELNLAGRAGSTLNVLAIDGDAVVSLMGTKWAGDELHLVGHTGRGVSNTITEDGARVRVHEGTVLVVTERRATES